MRRTEFESLGRKPQEYADIARFSDEGFQTRDKQKIQKLIGGAIISCGSVPSDCELCVKALFGAKCKQIVKIMNSLLKTLYIVV